MIVPVLALLFVLVSSQGRADTGVYCGKMVMPASGLREVTTGFGYTRGGHFHSGVDLMAPYGSPIRAAAAGTIAFAGPYFAYGTIVDILHTGGVVTRYAHMSRVAPMIAIGARVEAGDVIGAVGTSGHAHGPHVHFEVRVGGRAIDPEPFIGLAACRAAPNGEPIEVAQASEDVPSFALAPHGMGPRRHAVHRRRH